MASYAESTGGLSQSAVNQIATAVAQGLKMGSKDSAVTPHEKRQQEYVSGIQKEAALARALTTEAGLFLRRPQLVIVEK